jgi:RNA polymerase sigma factor (sigma-70 family)
MASSRLNVLLQQLRGFVRPPDDGVTDAQLLSRWLTSRDEAAFELLVWRHGPTVLGVCQRLLRRSQDIEDAFQATFLVFLRKAQTIGKGNAVAGWLYQVAYRVALQSRQRRSHQALLDGRDVLIPAPGTTDLADWHDIRPVLDDEVNRLPVRYRTVILLCCLKGKTNEEAARELGVPIGTVLSRLARARAQLRARLTRRGVSLTAGVLAAGWAAEASASVPSCLVVSTMKAALLGTAEEAAAAGVVSAQAAALTKGALHVMWLSKLQTTVAALILSVALIGGGGLFAYGTLAAGPGKGSGHVTRGDETVPENGNDRAKEEERQAANVEKAEDQRLKKLLEDATLRARKLERENDQLKKRLQELEDKLASNRTASNSGGDNRTTTSQPLENVRSDTRSAATVDMKARNHGSAVRRPGSGMPTGATPAVEQDAKDEVEIMQAQLQVKKAELQGAMVDLQAAQRNMTRVKALAGTRAISNEVVQAAEDKLASQKVAVQVKEAQLYEQEVRLRQANHRLDQLRTKKEAQRTPVPAADPQQLQEIRKILKELERKLDSIERAARPSAPPPSRR